MSSWPSLIWLAGGVLLGVVVAFAAAKWRQRASAYTADRQAYSSLDTVIGWQPERVRILTRNERRVLLALTEALPEYTVLVKLPVARFVRVPKRNSFNEWLDRVGYLTADFVVCEKASDVITVVQLLSEKPSERSERRHYRLKRVLNAAGVRLVMWTANEPPYARMIRDKVLPGTESPTLPGVDSLPPVIDTPVDHRIPVAEINERGGEHDPARRDPPSSTWYSDFDSVSPSRSDERRV